MSGHHPWSELKKNFTPEQTKRIKVQVENAIAGMERERHAEIRIPPIALEWSRWHSWLDVEQDARYDGAVVVPDGQPGVYEVKLDGERKLLAIGRTNDLRMRIKQGLVRGKVPHSVGKKIRAAIKNDELHPSDIGIRWAVTDRPAAVEEELMMRHKGKFGGLPKYSKHG